MQGLQHLASLVSVPPPEIVGTQAMELAALALVDLVGVTLAGSREPVADLIANYVGGHSGEAAVIGRGLHVTAADAALANGTLGHALDYDDSNFVLGGHPSVVIYPAILAVGQQIKTSGARVLAAYTVGFEVMMRLARAVNFEHYDRGWHPTATLGIFGATAATARLLGLDAVRAAHALGLSASMASGVKANFGTMSKPIQVGHAASKGVTCAVLAQSGLTASAAALEGEQGFLAVYNGKGNYRTEALAGTGTPELLASGLKFKRYPCCGSTHVIIDTVKALRGSGPVPVTEIAAVEVLMNPRRRPHVDRPVVVEPLEGKFSAQYTAAAALIDDDVGLGHFTSEAVGRRDVQDLLGRVTVAGFDDVAADLGQPCRVTVRLRDGSERSAALDGPVGRDVGDYRATMPSKFLDCAGRVTDVDTASGLLAELGAIASLADINPLMERLTLA